MKKIKGFFYSILLRISLALHSAEQDIREVADDVDPSKRREYKNRNNNPLLKKMEDGDRDEKYVKDFYTVLKKADHFIKHASEQQIAVAADKHGVDYKQKDRWGRRLDHYGFFDPKHKHYGKTLAEVIEAQAEERKTKDDNFPVIFMINNHQQLDGFAKLNDVQETEKGTIELKNELERKKLTKFRISVVRDVPTINKIEQLTDFLHVKRIDHEVRILEFFIDKQFKVNELSEDSDIYKELINVNQVWFHDEWGTKYGYSVYEYNKRINYDEQYEVIKFNAKEIVKI